MHDECKRKRIVTIVTQKSITDVQGKKKSSSRLSPPIFGITLKIISQLLYLKNRVAVVEQVLRGYGGRHVGWSSCHESYGFRSCDVLHHDFQLRHSLHERLDKYGMVSGARSIELIAPSFQRSRTNRGRKRTSARHTARHAVRSILLS